MFARWPDVDMRAANVAVLEQRKPVEYRRVRKAACPLSTASLPTIRLRKKQRGCTQPLYLNLRMQGRFLGCVGGFERLRGGITDVGTQSAHFRFVIRPNVRSKSGHSAECH
jgi:hypothetical protein